MRALPGDWNQLLEERHDQWTLYALPLLRHWKVFLAVAILTLVGVIEISLSIPRMYATTIKLMAGNPSQGGSPAAADALPALNAILAMTGQQSAETYADLLQEAPLADQVIHRLKLHVDSLTLLERLKVSPVTNTAIISLTVRWPTASGSAAIANEYGDAFIRQQRAAVQRQANEAIGYLEEQIPIAERKMNAAQLAEAAYQSRNAIADIGTQTQAMLQRVAALDTKYGETRLDQLHASASLARAEELLRSVSASTPTDRSVISNPGRQQLVSQRAQVEVQLRSAQHEYTPEHPSVIALRNQLRELDREIAAQPQTVVGYANSGPNHLHEQLLEQRAALQAQARSDAAQLVEIDAQRQALKPAIVRLPTQAKRLVDLRRQSKETQDIYAQLRAKYNEASLERTTIPSNIAVVVRATPDSASITPSLRTNLLAGFALSIALGVTAMFVANFFDRTLKSERDVERELSLPVLTHIAKIGTSRHEPLVPERAMRVESFLQLIWSVRYASAQPIRSITIVSASPEEGKSTVAVNAAAALADAQPGILLIDADLRRPTLHTLLGHHRALGLSDVLAGLATLDSVVRATKHPGLFLLSAGSPVPNPAKLLQTDNFKRLMSEAQERYAMVFVDTPALNVVFDGAVPCVSTDATVLVVASAVTDIRQARRALRRLSSLRLDNLMGVVLNRSKPPAAEYSSYFSDVLPPQVSLPARID